jgi:CRP/FNR family transcriptional regulator
MDNMASLRELLSKGKRQNVPKGQVLQFSEHDKYLSLIESGYIKRYSIDSDGSQGIQIINGPQEIFPLTPVFKTFFDIDISGGDPDTYYYEAMTDTVLYSIGQKMLQTAAEHDPLIYKNLLAASAVRFQSNIQRMENMSLRTTHRRIAHLLAFFAEKFGKQENQQIAIQVPLTQQTIGSLLNVARETVTRKLTRLEEKGLISSSGKIIIVHDLNKLKAEIR